VILNLNNKNIFDFSDTHGNHRALQVPEIVDIVICAGDAVEDNLV
jgi:predicted phosphodiesterase